MAANTTGFFIAMRARSMLACVCVWWSGRRKVREAQGIGTQQRSRRKGQSCTGRGHRAEAHSKGTGREGQRKEHRQKGTQRAGEGHTEGRTGRSRGRTGAGKAQGTARAHRGAHSKAQRTRHSKATPPRPPRFTGRAQRGAQWAQEGRRRAQGSRGAGAQHRRTEGRTEGAQGKVPPRFSLHSTSGGAQGPWPRMPPRFRHRAQQGRCHRGSA
jgi:hypothetical protein